MEKISNADGLKLTVSGNSSPSSPRLLP